ncbi:MAG: fused MFS/spermidine synthase [bacterium]
MKKPSDCQADATFSTAQRGYLFLTAAVAGAAIMIIEILGAKMLAPYVGTSHFVWTAQIAVTLLALTAGYYAGGRWADRSPRPASLYLAILAAAVYLCVAVTQVERAACFCLRFKLAAGSLLASSFLFFVPLALLALTGPFLVRLLTPVLQNVGGSMGRLTAVSTLGSVAGTLLIGYVLVPLLPNSMTMLLTAGALMLLAAGYIAIWGRQTGPKAGTLLALAIAAGCGVQVHAKGLLQAASYREIYRCNSNFGQLEVFESRHKPYRYFLNDNLTQGAYDTQRRQGLGSWIYLLHDLACAYTTNISDVLVIGLGIGITPMQFSREGAQVDVVEINPAVVPLARRCFDLQPERMNITLGDGRQFVAECKKRYDAIVLDAFLGDGAPSHLMTREAFMAMRRILRPDGVLVINCWGDFAAGRDFLVASLQKTLAHSFPGVCMRSSRDPGKVANVFVVASPTALTLYRPPDFGHVHPDSRTSAEETFARVVEADSHHGIVLTDDFNPADYYDAANREESRRAMVASMQAVASERSTSQYGRKPPEGGTTNTPKRGAICL